VTKIATTPPCAGGHQRAADKDSLRQDLQAVLGQLFDLHVQGVEAHAHFVGTSFIGFQRQLEAVVQLAREAGNAVADALRGLDGDGTRRLLITHVSPAIPGLRPGERCTTAAVNMIACRMSFVLNTIRCVRNQVGDADTSAAALLAVVEEAVEEQAMMLASESRRINSATCPALTPSTAEPPTDWGPPNAR
jgi:starvation-inducible DNA-binding protein